MSAYGVASLPNIRGPICQDIFCLLDPCPGPENHGVKKPWYMTQTPVLDSSLDESPPIELMKMGGWVLEKFNEADNESSLCQYCPSEQWKKTLTITEIREGYCNACSESIPEEMVAAYTMHNWNMLQKYDADMKKYGADPYTSESTDVNIQVFR